MHSLEVAPGHPPPSWRSRANLPPVVAASKVDVIVQHIMTRDLRLTKRRPYRVEGGRTVFDDPPPRDLDGRVEGPNFDDPYAEIFVTVPPAPGPPS
jgi:hypothetical protein